MKKIIFFLSLLICCTTLFAATAPINKIVFFGDSLTDDGNLYRLVFKIIPKSPPYYKGRFTNGRTWAELIAKHYYDRYYLDSSNYAIGGATAIFHKFTGRFFSPTLLEIEVDKYLLDSLFRDKSTALYSIWIGGNDYLYDETTDVDTGTSKVVDKIESVMRKLISYGAQYFLLFNLPDLSKVPMGSESNSASRLQALTILNNQKLTQAVLNIQARYPTVKIIFVDVFNVFNDLMAHPEVYNEKYKLDIHNTSEPCWMGGFFYKKFATGETLKQDFAKAFSVKGMTPIKDFDFESMNNFVFNSPVLSHAYTMGKLYELGMQPCGNPDQYVFWDHIHPTKVMHQLISLLAQQGIDSTLGDNLQPSVT